MVKLIIYCITNTINGKEYVGLTTRTLPERFQEHCKAKSYIGNAVRKHGVENFTACIIDTAQSATELYLKETWWIKEKDTYFNGYNQTLGGDGVIELKPIKVDLNDRQKRFIRVVEKRKAQPIPDTYFGMALDCLINLIAMYLESDNVRDKKGCAKILHKLHPELEEIALSLGVVDKNEIKEWCEYNESSYRRLDYT